MQFLIPLVPLPCMNGKYSICSGIWLWDLFRDHCENIVFQENIKFKKNCQKFLFEA